MGLGIRSGHPDLLARTPVGLAGGGFLRSRSQDRGDGIFLLIFLLTGDTATKGSSVRGMPRPLPSSPRPARSGTTGSSAPVVHVARAPDADGAGLRTLVEALARQAAETLWWRAHTARHAGEPVHNDRESDGHE